jgi:hypothetical protein
LSPSSELSDDSVPANGLFPTRTKKFDPKKHKAGTRRGLAITAFVVLLVFYAVLLGLFVTRAITLQELTALIAAFSGLNAHRGRLRVLLRQVVTSAVRVLVAHGFDGT